MAAAATGARCGAVTLLHERELRMVGGHALPHGSEPSAECHRIAASGTAVATGAGYVGVPVVATDGTVLGTVCVFGDIPAGEDEIALLEDVAASVLAEVDLACTAEAARREQRIGARRSSTPRPTASCASTRPASSWAGAPARSAPSATP